MKISTGVVCLPLVLIEVYAFTNIKVPTVHHNAIHWSKPSHEGRQHSLRGRLRTRVVPPDGEVLDSTNIFEVEPRRIISPPLEDTNTLKEEDAESSRVSIIHGPAEVVLPVVCESIEVETPASSGEPSISLPNVPIPRTLRAAWSRAMENPMEVLTIPITAAFVGWITNKIAVDMIFYPLEWKGLNIWRVPGEPFGLFGWQGIVPAKCTAFSARLTDVVTRDLVDVNEVFGRLNPRRIVKLLRPEIPKVISEVSGDLLPKWLLWLPGAAGSGLTVPQVEAVNLLSDRMITGLVTDLKADPTKYMDLQELIVGEMEQDKSLLVNLMQQCGREEFKFLVNSGLWFGFLLGLIQMCVWLYFSKPWTIPFGGFIVGIITNWIALKLIFEPIDPVYVGPIKLHGLFLRRQDEVSGEFATFFTQKILRADKMWRLAFFGVRSPVFLALIKKHLIPFIQQSSACVGARVDRTLATGLAAKAAPLLSDHVHVLHEYTDTALDLKDTIEIQMKSLSSRTFEGLLHPIFQEDEFTLIVAGGVLGFGAGFLQMLWSTKPHIPPPEGGEKGPKKGMLISSAQLKSIVSICIRTVCRPVVQSGRAARHQCIRLTSHLGQKLLIKFNLKLRKGVRERLRLGRGGTYGGIDPS